MCVLLIFEVLLFALPRDEVGNDVRGKKIQLRPVPEKTGLVYREGVEETQQLLFSGNGVGDMLIIAVTALEIQSLHPLERPVLEEELLFILEPYAALFVHEFTQELEPVVAHVKRGVLP